MDAVAYRKFLDDLVADPSLQPIYTKSGNLFKTYCNKGALRTAAVQRCKEFELMELLADDMWRFITQNESGGWEKAPGSEATEHAIKGGLAYAVLPSHILKEDHGHIGPIYPAPMQLSGSLGKKVPMVANIGKGDPSKDLESLPDGNQTKPNWICRVSQAFPVFCGEPEYHLWKNISK